MVLGAGIEPARLAAGDFESPASTNFTTRARGIALSAYSRLVPPLSMRLVVSYFDETPILHAGGAFERAMNYDHTYLRLD